MPDRALHRNDFWLRVAKRDMVEWLNLMAPLNYIAPNPTDMINGTPYPFLWPSTQASVVDPAGTLIINPQFGKMTLADCLSLFLERLICDPTDVGTACFDPGAQEILGPFDPGCWIFQLTVLVADVIAGLSEFSYHWFDDVEFFTFVDRQFTTTIWKDDLVLLTKCVFDAFAIIPVMGPCLSRLFVGIVQLVLCILDFLIRFIASLVFLAFYIINNIPCFITEKGRAQLFIRQLLDEFADVDNPDSVINCLCFMLNFGIQVPPIPCSACIPGGFLQPPPPTKRKGAPVMAIDLDAAHSIMSDSTPVPGLDYWSRGDPRWTNHTRNAKPGHRPRVQSVLQELRTLSGHGHKRSFYDSFRKGTSRFSEYVSYSKMTSFFKKRRERFQHKLDNYLKPWREQRAQWIVRKRWEQHHSNTSPNPGHPTHWSKPWLAILQKGRARSIPAGDRPYFSVKEDVDAMKFAASQSREVITPTEPPIMGCTPTPPCFDTCDIFRSSFVFFDKLITLLTDMLFSLLQDWDIAFPYYVTGDVSICSLLCPTVDQMAPDCTVACPGINISIEEDLRQAVVAFADLFRAFCNLLNLVVPVEIPGLVTMRPDICCSVVRLGDLVACILLVIIKSVKSLALEDDTGFPYFTMGLFLMDVDLLFDLTFDVVVCVCNVVRAVFPVQNVADLDLCCIVQNGAMALIELAQWAFQIVISLGTIQTSGNSYFVDPACGWTDSGCDPNVNSIGYVVQGDIVFDSIFGAEGGACSNSFSTSGGCGPLHGKDMGVGGVITCVCQLVTTIFPVRPDPGLPTSETNCPIVDMCCVLRRGGFAANSLLKFANRMLATTWQRWEGNPILPAAFIAFWFCDENTAPPGSPCGQFNPIIVNIVSLVSQCICEFFVLVDAFFRNAWPSFSCFCGTFDGIFCGIAGLVQVIVINVVELFRRLGDATYWQPRRATATPFELTLSGGTFVAINEADTWAMRFFGPIALESCRFAASIVCFIQVIVPKCTITRAVIAESFVVWIFEGVIRVAEFIEGFVLTFAGRGCSGSSNQGNGYSWNTECLTGAFISLLSFPVDALIAEASVVCGGSPCGCYVEPYQLSEANYAQVTNNKCVLAGQLNNIADSLQGYTDCATTMIGAFEQCRQRCVPSQANLAGKCVDIPLPICFDRFGAPIFIDGIIMAGMKYFRCMLAVVFPFFASFNPADALILFLAILWQISRAVINFIAAFIVFFFVLFTIGAGIGGCRCHNGTLAIQRNGAFCYHCRDPDNTSIDADPGVSDVIVPQGGQFKSNNCCRKSTYSNVPGLEFCEGVPSTSPASPKVICSGLNLVGAFFNLLSAFVGIFTAFASIVAPNPNNIPTVKRTRGPVYGPMTKAQTEAHETYQRKASARYHTLRSRYNNTKSDDSARYRYAFHRWIKGQRDPHARSRQHFKKRAAYAARNSMFMSAGLYTHGMAKGEEYGEVPEVLMDALFGFDTDDCMDDPIACICRNMDVPDVCAWDPEHDEATADHVVSTHEVMHAMTLVFDNHTVCDAVIRDMDQVSWIDVPFAIRAEYMECLELRIQGERIRDMYAGFPADMFYSPKDGLPELMLNVHRDWNWMYTEDVNQRAQEEKQYQRKRVLGTRFDNFQKKLDARRAKFKASAAKANTSAVRNTLHFLARLDQFDYKLNSGYYAHHAGGAWKRLERGGTMRPVSMLKRIQVVAGHSVNGGHLFLHGMSRMTEFPALTWNIGVQTSLQIQDMYKRGTGKVLAEGWQRYKDALAMDHRARGPPPREYLEKQERVRKALVQSPFYKWLFGDKSNSNTKKHETPLHNAILTPFARFRKHLTAVFAHQRALAINGTLNRATGKRIRQNNIFNMWGAHAQWEALKAAFWKRWAPRPLTVKQRENRFHGWRAMNKIRYMWDPQSVPRETYERFIFGCDCAVVDGTLALLVDIVNFCATSFVPNVPMLKRIAHDVVYREKLLGGMWSPRVHEAINYTIQKGAVLRFVERIEPMVRDTNYTFHYRRHHLSGRSSRAQYRLEAWPIPKSDTDFYYIRPRITTPVKERPLHRDLSKIDARQWRRNQNSGGAADFNLFVWFTCIFDDIFGTSLSTSLEQWFMDLTTWFNNPNLDPADYPNVGFVYWITFFIRCEFPQNLDCSIGVGLEDAFRYVLLVFVFAFIIGAFIFPSILIPLMTVGVFLAFVIAIPMIAWHYSPRCWLMTPSVIQGPISIPLWPFPIAPPSVPFCALADLQALLDKYITTCYAFLIPRYMIRGPVCPPCPQRVDWINCEDVRVSDGLQHIIWIGTQAFGDGFCDWLMYTSQTSFFQSWFPGFDEYTTETCTFFQNPTQTQKDRSRWCFYATLPAIFLPITIGVLAATLFGFLVPAILNLFVAFVFLLAASPLIVAVPGGGSSYYYHPGDQRTPEQYIEDDMNAFYARQQRGRRQGRR